MRAIIALALTTLMGCIAVPSGPSQDPEKRALAIETLIKEVQRALVNVQEDLDAEKLPPLKSVVLSLQASMVAKAGGKIKLLILSMGASRENTRTQQIDITLTPSRPGNAKDISALSRSLEEAILAAARGVRDAAKDSKVPLRVAKLKVKLGFTIKDAAGAGGSKEIIPITIDLTGDLSRTDVQVLELTFESKA